MKLNTVRAKQAAIDTGAAVAGAVAVHALVNFASDKLATDHPTIVEHIPAAVAVLLMAAQAFEIAPKGNAAIDSALLGGSVIAVSGAVRNYTGANDPATNTTGAGHLVNTYFPPTGGGMNGLGSAPAWGIPYSEPMALSQYADGSTGGSQWAMPQLPQGDYEKARRAVRVMDVVERG